MDQTLAARVDTYFCEALVPADPALQKAWDNGQAAGLPMRASVSPLQGRFLQVLAQSVGAERVLEIGTLGGYSAICLARGLANAESGMVLTLELNHYRAEAARETIRQVGLAGVVGVRTGPAIDTLLNLIAEGVQPFDLVHIDADKQNNARYFELTLQLSRPGTVIVVDNVIRGGTVLDATSGDPPVQGVRRLIDRLAEDPCVVATVLPTLTRKGYDGVLVATVL